MIEVILRIQEREGGEAGMFERLWKWKKKPVVIGSSPPIYTKVKQRRDFLGETGKKQKLYSAVQSGVAGASIFSGGFGGIVSWLATPVAGGGIGIGIGLGVASLVGMSASAVICLIVAGVVGWWFYHDYIDGANLARKNRASENRKYFIYKILLKEAYLLHFLTTCRYYYRGGKLLENIDEELRRLEMEEEKNKEEITNLSKFKQLIEEQTLDWIVELLNIENEELAKQLRQFSIERAKATLIKKLEKSGLNVEKAKERVASLPIAQDEIARILLTKSEKRSPSFLPEMQGHFNRVSNILFEENYCQQRKAPVRVVTPKLFQTLLNLGVISLMFSVTVFGIGFGTHTTILTVGVGLAAALTVLSSTNIFTLAILASAIVLGVVFGLIYAYFKYKNLQREEVVINLKNKNSQLETDYHDIDRSYQRAYGANEEREKTQKIAVQSEKGKGKEKLKAYQKSAEASPTEALQAGTAENIKLGKPDQPKRQLKRSKSLILSTSSFSDEGQQSTWGSNSFIGGITASPILAADDGTPSAPEENPTRLAPRLMQTAKNN